MAPLAGQVGQAAVPPRDAVDDMVDEAVADWQPLLGPLLEPLYDALAAALKRGDDVDTFRAALPELLASMDHRALAERLAAPAFRVRLAGEADLDLSNSQA